MVNTGDTAWILTSAALVLLMTPGLALFYGGMVRVKSVLNMMMMSFGALALISVLWVLYGYSLAFGNDVGAGLLGSPTEFLGLHGLMEDLTSDSGGLPAMAFVAFQAVFAIITVALISGAIADRARFGTWMVLAGVWATLVYFPVAHWVFDFDAGSHVGGWIANNLLAIDFAGGTAVHINAGAAGLALALVLGKRRGFGKEPMRPHNLPLVMIGAGLLWFGCSGSTPGRRWPPTTPRRSPGSTRSPPPVRPAWAGWQPSGCVTGTPRRWARHRASSPAWWRSLRRVRRCRRWARSCSAPSPACCALSPWD